MKKVKFKRARRKNAVKGARKRTASRKKRIRCFKTVQGPGQPVISEKEILEMLHDPNKVLTRDIRRKRYVTIGPFDHPYDADACRHFLTWRFRRKLRKKNQEANSPR